MQLIAYPFAEAGTGKDLTILVLSSLTLIAAIYAAGGGKNNWVLLWDWVDLLFAGFGM